MGFPSCVMIDYSDDTFATGTTAIIETGSWCLQTWDMYRLPPIPLSYFLDGLFHRSSRAHYARARLAIRMRRALAHTTLTCRRWLWNDRCTTRADPPYVGSG